MSLFKKHTGEKEFKQLKSLVYGNPKVGKTTALAGVKGLWFLATERGYSFIECTVADIFNWQDALKVLAEIKTLPKGQCEGVVIDTVNNFIEMAEVSYCAQHKITHLSDHAFGKGYNGVKEMVLKYLVELESLGLSIHLISHAKEKELASKVRKETVVMPNMSQGMMDAMTGFVDQIFFCYIDQDGRRMMRTKPSRNIIAGDRSGKLPELMELDFKKVQELITTTKKEGVTK
jgi:hypothetical protein